MEGETERLIQSKLFRRGCVDVSALLPPKSLSSKTLENFKTMTSSQQRQVVNRLTCEFAENRGLYTQGGQMLEEFVLNLRSILEDLTSSITSAPTARLKLQSQLIYCTAALMLRCGRSQEVARLVSVVVEHPRFCSSGESCEFARLVLTYTLLLAQIDKERCHSSRTRVAFTELLQDRLESSEVIQARTEREMVLNAVVLELWLLHKDEEKDKIRSLICAAQARFDLAAVDSRFRRFLRIFHGMSDFKDGALESAKEKFTDLEHRNDSFGCLRYIVLADICKKQEAFSSSLKHLQDALDMANDGLLLRLILQNALKVISSATQRRPNLAAGYRALEEKFLAVLMQDQRQETDKDPFSRQDSESHSCLGNSSTSSSQIWEASDLHWLKIRSLIARCEFTAALEAVKSNCPIEQPRRTLLTAFLMVCCKRFNEATELLVLPESKLNHKSALQQVLLRCEILFETGKYNGAANSLRSLVSAASKQDSLMHSVVAHNLGLLTHCGFDTQLNSSALEATEFLDHSLRACKANRLSAQELSILSCMRGDREKAMLGWRHVAAFGREEPLRVPRITGRNMPEVVLVAPNFFEKVSEQERLKIEECVLLWT